MKKTVINKSELERLYLEEGLNTTQIGNRYGLGREAIRQRLIQHEIPRRDNSRRHVGFRHSEETKESLSQLVQGGKHPFWGKCHSKESKMKMSKSHKGRFTGEQSPNWKGGKRMSGGYLFSKIPEHPNASSDGYIRNATVVAEKVLGRYLKKGELVHHINEVKLDDRNCNLLICNRSLHNVIHNRTRARRRHNDSME